MPTRSTDGTVITLVSAANLVVNGTPLVWGERLVTERSDEVEEYLARGLVTELDDEGAPVARALDAPPRKGCCGG